MCLREVVLRGGSKCEKSSYEVVRLSRDAKMVIDESIYIIVSVIRQKRKEDKRDTGIDDSIIEELTKARKESSGFHLGI